MKHKALHLAVVATALGAGLAHAETSEEQFRALEARIAQLEAQGAAAPVTGGTLDKIKVNGFMSAGFGSADVEDGLYYDNGLTDQVSYKADAIVGLQFDARVNDRTSAVLQLVARGTDDFAAGAEWAYVSYRPTDTDELRAGRLRASFYMMSEYLEVGYAYPWVRPPAEVYKHTFPSSFDGFSWLHSFDRGEWEHDLQVNVGATDTTSDENNPVLAEDAWGLLWSSSHGNWQLGAKLSSAKITSTNDLFNALGQLGLITPIDRETITYTSLGVTYDNGTLLAMVEGTKAKIDGVIPDGEAGYVTLGYRFGKVMPHITYAGTQVTDENERQPIAALPYQDDHVGNPSAVPDLCPLLDPNPNASICAAIVPNTTLLPATTLGIPLPADTLARALDSAQESVTLGVRYDFLPNAALKVDWTRVLDTHDTFGAINAFDGNLFYDATGALLARPADEFDAYRVAVDVVF